MVGKTKPEIAEDPHTVVKDRMAMIGPNGKMWERMRSTLKFLREHGTSRDIQLAVIGRIGCDNPEEKDETAFGHHAGRAKCSIF